MLLFLFSLGGGLFPQSAFFLSFRYLGPPKALGSLEFLKRTTVEQNSPLNCFKVQHQEDFCEMTKNKVVADRSLCGRGRLKEVGAC